MRPGVPPYRVYPMGGSATPATLPGRSTLKVRSLMLPLAAFAVLGGGFGAHAQDTTGSVHGSVMDSTTMAPLQDAAVFLWDTPYRATTDADGSFRMEGVAPGRYDAVFFHGRLGELGISAGPRVVEVRPGATTRVELAIPSGHTLMASSCALYPNYGGVAVGRATDGASGVPLPGVRIRFTWGPGDSGRVREVRTDGEGWFQACDLPRGPTVAVTSEFLGRGSLRREFRLGTEPALIDLPVEELELTDVEGRLVDAETGEGVQDATVTLAGTGFRTVSGGDGRFRFRDVLPGHYTLRTEHLAYGAREDSLDLGSGLNVLLEVQVSQRPVPLDPVTVTVEAATLTERAMGGTVITSAMLDEVRDHSRDLLDLLQAQNLGGLIVRRQSGNLCVGFIPGQVRITFRGGCVPALVFIDNVRAADPLLALDIPADVVDRIVLYRPIEAGNLFGLGGGNGVVMVFTKRR